MDSARATPPPRVTPATAVGEGEKGGNDRQHGLKCFPPPLAGTTGEEGLLRRDRDGGKMGGGSLQSVPIIIVRLR